jgi:hypothetical protein
VRGSDVFSCPGSSSAATRADEGDFAEVDDVAMKLLCREHGTLQDVRVVDEEVSLRGAVENEVSL